MACLQQTLEEMPPLGNFTQVTTPAEVMNGTSLKQHTPSALVFRNYLSHAPHAPTGEHASTYFFFCTCAGVAASPS